MNRIKAIEYYANPQDRIGSCAAQQARVFLQVSRDSAFCFFIDYVYVI